MAKDNSYERISRERDDVAIMKTPQIWPCWPFLPVKRVRNGIETAVLGAFSEAPLTRLYLCNMYDFDHTKFKDYESAEAIAADGWIVD